MNPPPKLAAPGAGLPKIERYFANLMIHWKAKRTSREAAAWHFMTGYHMQLHRKQMELILAGHSKI